MPKYNNLKTSKEFMALMKRLYFPSDKTVEEIEVPKMKFLSFEGKGAPASSAFQQAIQCLYGMAFSIKMGLKFGKIKSPTGYFDFKMPPLEGLWWQAGQWDANHPENWKWQLLIMMPNFVDEKLVSEARAMAEQKHPELPYSAVKLVEYEEGQAIQILHIGPYSDEPKTVERLMEYAGDHVEKIAGHHHEIYMGDPRRTKPERLKTVLRYAVSK